MAVVRLMRLTSDGIRFLYQSWLQPPDTFLLYSNNKFSIVSNYPVLITAYQIVSRYSAVISTLEMSSRNTSNTGRQLDWVPEDPSRDRHGRRTYYDLPSDDETDREVHRPMSQRGGNAHHWDIHNLHYSPRHDQTSMGRESTRSRHYPRSARRWDPDVFESPHSTRMTRTPVNPEFLRSAPLHREIRDLNAAQSEYVSNSVPGTSVFRLKREPGGRHAGSTGLERITRREAEDIEAAYLQQHELVPLVEETMRGYWH